MPPPPPPLTWKTRLKIAAASAGGVVLAHILGGLTRLKAEEFEALDRHRGPHHSLLMAVWHGDHFPMLYTYRHRGVCTIASHSADGQILTNILQHFGYNCVRGSSSRGGARALIDLARVVRAGADAAIAVDGPRGPRHVVKPGIILLAKITGCPIIPFTTALDRYWQFNSWDRYHLPKPFSRGLIRFGAPMHIPRDADDDFLELKRLELQNTLTVMTDQSKQDLPRI